MLYLACLLLLLWGSCSSERASKGKRGDGKRKKKRRRRRWDALCCPERPVAEILYSLIDLPLVV